MYIHVVAQHPEFVDQIPSLLAKFIFLVNN